MGRISFAKFGDVRVELLHEREDTSFAEVLEPVEVRAGSSDYSLSYKVQDSRGVPYYMGSIGRGKSGFFMPRGALGVHTLTVLREGEVLGTIPFVVEAAACVRTGQDMYDTFLERIKSFLLNDISAYYVNGRTVKGHRSPDTRPIWIRDHTHQMKGFKYWESDMKSAVDYFIKMQMEDGSFYDFVTRAEEEPPKDPETHPKVKYDKEHHLVNVRCMVEADVEYLVVEAAYTAWQATGDDGWLKSVLPALERGLEYSMKDPLRWDEKHGLVKRGFTIDTWDFEYGDLVETKSGKHHRDNIDNKTHFCIMHGDNSGLYKACCLMAKIYRYFAEQEEGSSKEELLRKAERWEKEAFGIKERVNKVCWNGKFYTHQVHLDGFHAEGVNEEEQLSLSNTYDMNRGIAEHSQCVSIIKEYQRRRKTTKAFAEWFSIDPPFPSGVFGLDYLHPGIYVNGGIMPLVGGELARAAFEHGFEDYGLDILKRYYIMIKETGKTFLWYQPDGTPAGGGNLPTDGWGSAAMLYAFMEGLCGVEDERKLYEKVRLSPRWVVTGLKQAKVIARYGASDGYVAYIFRWLEEDKRIELQFTGSGKEINFHLLLPKGAIPTGVTCNGRELDFSFGKVEESPYVDFSVPVSHGAVSVDYKLED